MGKIKIKKSDLKEAALNATGRQLYGMDEYIYIKSFNYDDNNSIKVSFYLLLKVDENTFDLIPNTSSPEYTYSIADGRIFTDIDGYNVYSTDVSGNTIYEDVQVDSIDASGNTVTNTVSQPVKRTNDFTRNFTAFSALIIPSIFKDVNNYLGYHNNENGTIDNQ
jgi:hypothetical protein